MKKTILTMAVMAVAALYPADGSAVSIGTIDFETSPGGLHASMVSIDPGVSPMFDYRGFQFDVLLPTGISVELDKSQFASASLEKFELSSEGYDGTRCRFIAYTSADPVATTGQVISLTFKAAEDISAGDYDVEISRVIFSSPKGVDINGEGSEFTITVIVPDSEASINIDDFTINRGETWTATSTLRLPEGESLAYDGFQFDITLPDHISVESAALTAAQAGSGLTWDLQADGDWRFMVTRPSTGTATDLIDITFVADNEAAAGTFTADISSVVFSDPYGHDLNLKPSNFNITVKVPETPPGPEIPETPEVPATPIPDGTTGNGNGTYVEPVRIREGNELLMGVNEPTGGYESGFEYLWTAPDGEEIGWEREIRATALLYGEAAQSGERQAISDNVYEVTLSNYDEEGALFWETTLETATVKVYKRPQAPAQLLRKGQHPAGGQTPETGTSCTFVVMMTPLDNQEILDLGYSYTYGYTDRGGMMHELGTTELRYIHTTPEIYWNEDYTFWAYSRWTYPDGSVVTSGLRYLDGGEDYGFDASDFDGTRGSGIAAVESEGNARGIYTLDGRYLGEDASALGRGLYIINGRKVIR